SPTISQMMSMPPASQQVLTSPLRHSARAASAEPARMRAHPLAATIDPMNKNVFVLGMDDANHEVLRGLPGTDAITFHQLLTQDELQEGEVNVPDLLDRAETQLAEFDGSVDAIVTYW